MVAQIRKKLFLIKTHVTPHALSVIEMQRWPVLTTKLSVESKHLLGEKELLKLTTTIAYILAQISGGAVGIVSSLTRQNSAHISAFRMILLEKQMCYIMYDSTKSGKGISAEGSNIGITFESMI